MWLMDSSQNLYLESEMPRNLGSFLSINKQGKSLKEQDRIDHVWNVRRPTKESAMQSITNDYPVSITTHPVDTEEVPEEERRKLLKLVQSYSSTVFNKKKYWTGESSAYTSRV